MKYDLGSYLTRKRISLQEFAATNNIKSVNDIGMFMLNNKTFEVSDATIEELTKLVELHNDKPAEELEMIAPMMNELAGDGGVEDEEDGKDVFAANKPSEQTPVKKTTSGGKKQQQPAAKQ